MGQYHINPTTGEANICQAKIKCRFGLATEHYESKILAQKAFEKVMQETISAPTEDLAFKTSRNYSESLKSDGGNYEFESIAFPGYKILGDYAWDEWGNAFKGIKAHEFWLQDKDGENVAYLHLIHAGEGEDWHKEPFFKMCDIEVRLDSRGKGFGKALRADVEAYTKTEIYSSGSFTPEGWDAFGKTSRYYPWVMEKYGDPPAVKFRTMGFVASWKNRLPRNGARNIDYEERSDYYWSKEGEERLRALNDKKILWAED